MTEPNFIGAKQALFGGEAGRESYEITLLMPEIRERIIDILGCDSSEIDISVTIFDGNKLHLSLRGKEIVQKQTLEIWKAVKEILDSFYLPFPHAEVELGCMSIMKD